jgi:hypothetical protein
MLDVIVPYLALSNICIPCMRLTRDVLFCIFLLLTKSNQEDLMNFDKTVRGSSSNIATVKDLFK